MRFLVPYPYPTDFNQTGDNFRELADSLFDGQKDLKLNSANMISLKINTAPLNTTTLSVGMADKFFQIASNYWCPVISATL